MVNLELEDQVCQVYQVSRENEDYQAYLARMAHLVTMVSTVGSQEVSHVLLYNLGGRNYVDCVKLLFMLS